MQQMHQKRMPQIPDAPHSLGSDAPNPSNPPARAAPLDAAHSRRDYPLRQRDGCSGTATPAG